MKMPKPKWYECNPGEENHIAEIEKNRASFSRRFKLVEKLRLNIDTKFNMDPLLDTIECFKTTDGKAIIVQHTSDTKPIKGFRCLVNSLFSKCVKSYYRHVENLGLYA